MSTPAFDALAPAWTAHPGLAAPAATFDTLVAAHVAPGQLALCEALVCALLGAPVSPGDDPRRQIVADWRVADDFSPTERAVLAFAERFVLDPHGTTDAEVETLRATLGAPAVVALAAALAWLDGLTRARLALGAA